MDVSRPPLCRDGEPAVSLEQLRKPLATSGTHVEDSSCPGQKYLRLFHEVSWWSWTKSGQLHIHGPARHIVCPLDVGP